MIYISYPTDISRKLEQEFNLSFIITFFVYMYYAIYSLINFKRGKLIYEINVIEIFILFIDKIFKRCVYLL